MSLIPKNASIAARTAALLFVAALAGCAMGSRGDEYRLTLTGAQEVPPVSTSASGAGTLTVSGDGTVSGSFTTRGIAGTASHIHTGAPGQNGPVIIPLVKSGNDGWTVPAGARLTPEQFSRYKAGELYVNVHSKAHPGGEIRAQIRH
jgi:hypothetical protein